MRTVWNSILVTLVLLTHLQLHAVLAQEGRTLSHVVIPGFERFHTQEGTSLSDAGAILVGELNCIRCHQMEEAKEELPLQRQAPILSDVGKRVSVSFLKKFLANPQATKPGTLMPNLFAGLSREEQQLRVDALTHFLASTGTLIPTPPNTPSVKRGEELFHTIGCIACHQPQTGTGEWLSTSVPLGKPGWKI